MYVHGGHHIRPLLAIQCLVMPILVLSDALSFYGRESFQPSLVGRCMHDDTAVPLPF